MTILRVAIFANCICLAALPGTAQEIAFGAGATDFSSPGNDSAEFDIAYRHRPFHERRVLSVSLGANASVTTQGDLFAGGGVWGRWQFENGLFFDASVMPGFYDAGENDNDLGGNFQIRSLVGVGYRFDNGHAVSAAFSHKSNASTNAFNPGMNTYLIRYHIAF